MTSSECTSREGTSRRQRGGQPGNVNNAKSFSRSKRLVLGSMPKQLKRVERSVLGLRRDLEADVVAAYGEISTTMAGTIQTACRFEIASQLAARHLRLNGSTLDAKTRLAYLQAVAQNSAARDKCIRELRLDRAARGDGLGDYYDAESSPIEPGDHEGEPNTEAATGGKPESEEGNAED